MENVCLAEFHLMYYKMDNVKEQLTHLPDAIVDKIKDMENA